MVVGEVPKGIRWSAEAGGPPKVRIGGVSGRGRGPTEPLSMKMLSVLFLSMRRYRVIDSD